MPAFSVACDIFVSMYGTSNVITREACFLLLYNLKMSSLGRKLALPWCLGKKCDSKYSSDLSSALFGSAQSSAYVATEDTVEVIGDACSLTRECDNACLLRGMLFFAHTPLVVPTKQDYKTKTLSSTQPKKER